MESVSVEAVEVKSRLILYQAIRWEEKEKNENIICGQIFEDRDDDAVEVPERFQEKVGVNNETYEIMKSVEENIDNFTDISEDNPVIVMVFKEDPAVLAESVEA